MIMTENKFWSIDEMNDFFCRYVVNINTGFLNTEFDIYCSKSWKFEKKKQSFWFNYISWIRSHKAMNISSDVLDVHIKKDKVLHEDFLIVCISHDHVDKFNFWKRNQSEIVLLYKSHTDEVHLRILICLYNESFQ